MRSREKENQEINLTEGTVRRFEPPLSPRVSLHWAECFPLCPLCLCGSKRLRLIDRFLEALFLLVAIDIRNAVLHPIRFRRALEIMIEELLHAHRVVFLIRTTIKVMRLAVVHEQIAFLLQAAQRRPRRSTRSSAASARDPLERSASSG